VPANSERAGKLSVIKERMATQILDVLNVIQTIAPSPEARKEEETSVSSSPPEEGDQPALRRTSWFENAFQIELMLFAFDFKHLSAPVKLTY
jgi:hypothetical protein